jgi:hypothetical protein
MTWNMLDFKRITSAKIHFCNKIVSTRYNFNSLEHTKQLIKYKIINKMYKNNFSGIVFVIYRIPFLCVLLNTTPSDERIALGSG